MLSSRKQSQKNPSRLATFLPWPANAALECIHHRFGKRKLYSLRHTYITMKLLEGISQTVIAHQCGTSAEMIRLHYNHLTAQMFKKELIGNESGELTKLVRKYADLA